MDNAIGWGNMGDSVRMKRIIIAAPVYNEEDIILEFLGELNETLAQYRSKYDLEIFLVNDGSSDTTLQKIQMYQGEIPVRTVTLARNFGHQVACLVCLENSDADAVILMDSDMQDDPAAIHKFISCWEQGYYVAYAVRTSREEGALHRFLFRSFYRILHLMSHVKIPIDSGNFSLMDRKVVSSITQAHPKHWYLPGIRAYVGFPQCAVDVARRARHDQTSKVGMKGLFKLAFNALFSFSYLPLRIFNILGLIGLFVAFALLLGVVFLKVFTDLAVPAWPSIMSTVTFFGGINLIGIGVIGEYTAILHSRQQNLPNYTVLDEFFVKPAAANEIKPHE